eukprot:4567481-Amphidinium_carterae.1
MFASRDSLLFCHGEPRWNPFWSQAALYSRAQSKGTSSADALILPALSDRAQGDFCSCALSQEGETKHQVTEKRGEFEECEDQLCAMQWRSNDIVYNDSTFFLLLKGRVVLDNCSRSTWGEDMGKHGVSQQC